MIRKNKKILAASLALAAASTTGITLSSIAPANASTNNVSLSKLDQKVNIAGWQIASGYYTPRPITYMKSNFTVPKAPKYFNYQTLALFPSIMPAASDNIAAGH